MNHEPLSSEEAFHNCFFYFLKALEVMALDASAQCDVMGDYNVAWEIKQDVVDHGEALVKSQAIFLSTAERDAIAKLLMSLKGLPDAALLQLEQGRAMEHPAWERLRVMAAHLIDQLADAARRNRAFFEHST